MNWAVIELNMRIQGAKFRDRRIELGYETANEIADVLNVDVQKIELWERGERETPKKIRQQLLQMKPISWNPE